MKRFWIFACAALCCAQWGLGCAGSRRAGDAALLQEAVASLAAEVGPAAGQVLFVPLRDGAGEQTAETRLVDEALVSALLRGGADLTLADDEGGKWSGDEVPDRFWEEGAEELLFGRLRHDGGQAFVQLSLVQRGGQVLALGRSRLAANELERLAADRVRRAGGTVVRPLDVELHLVARHDEDQFATRIELAEKAEIELGDRLQLRFKLSRDAQVYAFLYDSEGESREIVAAGTYYSGRTHYGPGKETWVNPGQSDRVYTLYFIVAENLDEERDRMFEEMRRLVDEGRVDRFVGLELLDAVVAEYVEQRLKVDTAARVLRGADVELDKAEKIIYNDGTVLESRHERLRAKPALVRAISFSVY